MTTDAVYSIVMDHGDFVPLRAATPISLSIQQEVSIEQHVQAPSQTWLVRLTGYSYTFRSINGAEILAFHWHPEGSGFIVFPHFHIGSAMIARDAPVRPRTFHRAHIPTRHIAIEDIVHLAITELGVEPLREDWELVLMASAELSEGTRHSM